MKTFFHILVLTILFSNISFSQWKCINPQPTGSWLYGVKMLDADNAFMVGSAGYIGRTNDGGANWEMLNSGTGNTLKALHFCDKNNGIVVGLMGTILATSDGGNSWAQQACPSNRDLYGVSFINKNDGAAVGTKGTILITHDGGNNWISKTLDTTFDFYGVSYLTKTNLVAVGASNYTTYGGVYRSTDAGVSWNKVNCGQFGDLHGVSFIDSLRGTAVGFYNIVLQTVDGGISWTTQLNSSGRLNSICKVDELHQFAAGDGVFKVYSDGTIVELTNPKPDLYLGISFCDTSNGIAVGPEGEVIKTTDGGNTWTFSKKGTDAILWEVAFADKNNGMIVGMDIHKNAGMILRTKDGGVNWDSIVTQSTTSLYDIVYMNPGTAIAVGAYGLVLRTTDSGANWSVQHVDSTIALKDVAFWGSSSGIAVGDAGTILRTTDGGITWEKQISGVNYLLKGVSYRDADNLTIVGSTASVLISSDGGVTWAPQGFTNSPTESALKGVRFFDKNNGIIIGSGIYVTKNGGTTWSFIKDFFFTQLSDISYGDSANVYIVVGGVLLHSSDGGDTWSNEAFSPVQINGISYVGNDFGIAVGYGGMIMRYTNPVSSINSEIVVQKDFRLYQNYPNPFNPSTRITYVLPYESKVKLSIYNLLGQKITDLVNEMQSGGAKEVTFNAKGLASGIYLYKIEGSSADGKNRFQATKKLILLK
jgi:photosystem II stability/assembly factor-like uncharacterized protein